ncbi:DUF6318 family protein [Spongisporangium articulatum]|uniref:DUF6318 family protein n=1 Tax=Spongisporangium articulatum TaxID=3362603 RepID=A0ABW8AN72_9ACTN
MFAKARNTGLAVATVLVVLGLSACASGSASHQVVPDFTGDLTRPLDAPAGTGAPANPKPAAPVAEHTAHGAADVVRYFWNAYNYAYDTYDTAPLESVSRPGCSVCSEVSSDVRLIQAAGTQVRGHRMQLIDIDQIVGADGTSVRVEARISREDGVAVEADGSQTELPGLDPRHSTATLTWEDGAWKVDSIRTSA